MATPVTYKRIHTANAFLARSVIERYDATTDAYIPYTNGSATTTVGYYTGMDGTGAIAGLTGLPMAEVAGAPGTYAATVPSALLTALTPYDGQVIYQIVRAGATNNLQVVTPLMVTVPRWAQ